MSAQNRVTPAPPSASPAPSVPPPAYTSPPPSPPPPQYPVQTTQPEAYLGPPLHPPLQHPVFIGATTPNFGREPVRMQCPHCQQQISTRTIEQIGVGNWLLCGGLFLIGCTMGCCLIPLCISQLKDVIHKCPNCNEQVGEYRFL